MRENMVIDAPRHDEEASASPEPGGHPMELYISYVLRIGVMIAGTIILLGMILYLAGIGASAGNPQQLHDVIGNGGHSMPVNPSSILRGVASGNGSAIIQLGVLALILTPMTRVAMTAVLFIAQRDRLFVVITSVVFLVLVLGLLGVGS
ncbi:MAG TPA: DUF1634 domain-containing protein [Nitrolancea sp.]|nr:DUF1634 domain-containing protein [Nitrolancea sp.]